MDALIKAIGLAGSQQKLADKAGCTQQAISKWLRDGVVSPDYVIPVARAVDFDVTPHQLHQSQLR